MKRETMLKGSATAAIAGVLAAAMRGEAQACCGGIDLTYSDGPATTRRKTGGQPAKAIRLFMPDKDHPSLPNASGWSLVYTIASPVAVKGHDEDGRWHDHEHITPPGISNPTLYVYVK
jgi:hypothetical protein